jgi:hypothetical protein
LSKFLSLTSLGFGDYLIRRKIRSNGKNYHNNNIQVKIRRVETRELTTITINPNMVIKVLNIQRDGIKHHHCQKLFGKLVLLAMVLFNTITINDITKRSNNK